MIESQQRSLKTAAAVKVGVEDNFMCSLIVTRHIFFGNDRCCGLIPIFLTYTAAAVSGAGAVNVRDAEGNLNDIQWDGKSGGWH